MRNWHYFRYEDSFGILRKGDTIDHGTLIGGVCATEAEAKEEDVIHAPKRIKAGPLKGKWWAAWEEFYDLSNLRGSYTVEWLKKKDIPAVIRHALNAEARDYDFKEVETHAHHS